MSDERSAHESSGHDAQQELEHRALRNVRGLIDRMEADELAKSRSQKKVAVALVAAVAALIAVIVFGLTRAPQGAREVAVPPASKAPAR